MTDIGPTTPPPAYPMNFDVDRQLTDRNRLTTAFRVILAFPHLVLIGGAGFGLGWSSSSSGLIGAVASMMAVFAWFTIVFAAKHPKGFWDFGAFYLRWRARAVPYVMLLRDDYPPFEDAEYPTTFAVERPTGPRNRVTVGFRIILVIPHVIVLIFLNLAWIVTSIIAWFAILFTGRYPAGLYGFGVGVLRWDLRVETYLLLMRDEYPPFRLAP